MPPTLLFPSVKIHGHALMPECYEMQNEDNLVIKFQGHSLYVTFETGETVHLILHESGLDAYNRALEAEFEKVKAAAVVQDAEARALEAAEKRLAETAPSGVKEGQG